MSIVCSHCCCSNLYRATERYEWNTHHIYDDDDDWFVWMLLTHCCQKFSLTACRWWFVFLYLGSGSIGMFLCMCENVGNLLTSIDTTKNTNILSTTIKILTLDGRIASHVFWNEYLKFESVLEWKWFLFLFVANFFLKEQKYWKWNEDWNAQNCTGTNPNLAAPFRQLLKVKRKALKYICAYQWNVYQFQMINHTRGGCVRQWICTGICILHVVVSFIEL